MAFIKTCFPSTQFGNCHLISKSYALLRQSACVEVDIYACCNTDHITTGFGNHSYDSGNSSPETTTNCHITKTVSFW